MPARLTLLAALALLGLGISAAPAPAAGQAGTRVTVTGGTARSTATLNALGAVHAPLRLQKPETEGEGERPPRGRDPNSPPRATGRSLRSVSPSVAFGGTPLAFDGPSLADSGSYPPDTQGDVGPTQFIALVNGRIRSYDKTTGLADGVLDSNTDVWWSSVMTPGAGTYASDPRIRYDRLTDRWYAVMVDVPNGGKTVNRIMLAVSSSSSGTITSSTVWSFFQITGAAGEFADYPTLGVDANALYIGTNQFLLSNDSYAGTDGYVVRKSSLTTGGPVVATRFDIVASSSSSGPYSPEGVDNADPAASVGYFIGADNLVYGRLVLRRVSDPGGAPSLSGNLNVTIPATAAPSNVANSGGTALDALDDRVYSAQMRGDRIWTAHNIGVNASGTASSGGRTASRWYELNTGGPTGTPSLAQSGTVYDSAASNPREYWIPTVAVNGQGTMLIGGSTAAANTFVDAWYSGRRATDSAGVVDAPTRYTAASAPYTAPYDRWGDYSLTRVDPTDDLTLWTIQEYVNGTGSYGTRIARLRAPPPATPASASAVVPRGQPSTTVTITGTSSANSAFFDPGGDFAKRIAATVGCSVVVNSVTFNSGTSVTLDLDTTSAPKTLCPVTVTNPDGQSTSSTGGILQTDGRPVAAGDAGVVGQTGQLNGPSVLGNDSDPDADPLTAVVATLPAHGILSLSSNGTYTYTPTAGYAGPDSFTYRASDGLLLSTPATVSLTVTPGLPGTAPGAPTAASATPGDAQASVSWTAPTSDGGTPITRYTVIASPGGQTCIWSSGPLACEVTSLTNGTSYTFTITAGNASGEGSPSAPSAPVTPRAIPGAPSSAAATPGDGSAAVTWGAPASDGGAAITKYTVVASPGGQTCTWSVGPLGCTVAGLTNGTAHTFTVTATNAVGDGPASLPSAAVIPAAPVAPPPVAPPPVTPPGGQPLAPPVAFALPPSAPVPSPGPKAPAKLRVLRAGVAGGVLDMLVQITSRATAPGAKLGVTYLSSGLSTRFSVPIASAGAATVGGPRARAAEANVRVSRRLPAGQRKKNTGIVELAYAGSDSVRADAVRVRAATGKSRLRRVTTEIRDGRLIVVGTITGTARGVVRIRLGYAAAGDGVGFLYWNAPIGKGAWALDRQLPAPASAGGQLSIQFTGYEAAGLRGEQTAKQVLAG